MPTDTALLHKIVGGLAAALGVCVVAIIGFVVTTTTGDSADSREQRREMRASIAKHSARLTEHETQIRIIAEAVKGIEDRHKERDDQRLGSMPE